MVGMNPHIGACSSAKQNHIAEVCFSFLINIDDEIWAKYADISWENDYLEQQTYHFIPLIPALLWPKLGTDVNSILKCVSYGFGLTRPDWNKKKRILVYHHQVVYFLSGAKLGIWIFYDRVCVLCLPCMATGMTWIFMGHVTLER